MDTVITIQKEENKELGDAENVVASMVGGMLEEEKP